MKRSPRPFNSARPPRERQREALADRGRPGFGPVYRCSPTDPLDTASESLVLGAIGVLYGFMTGSRWTSEAAAMRAYDRDAMTAAIALAGGAHARLGGRRIRTRAGSAFLVDMSASTDGVAMASCVILVVVPRRVAEVAGLDVRALHGMLLESATSAMLAPHLLYLREAAAEMTAEEGARLGGIVLDLIGLAVAASGREIRRAGEMRQRTSLLMARQEIERGLGSPALSVAHLCRQLQISRTALHRLFEDQGGVTAYIRERRLEGARQMLADPENSDTIYRIAERLGFSDAAHLSRLFRQRFAFSPSDYRMASREADRPARKEV